jgi:arginase family enzyme
MAAADWPSMTCGRRWTISALIRAKVHRRGIARRHATRSRRGLLLLRTQAVQDRNLADTSSPVLDWVANEWITHLAIHFHVDVLDPAKFGPVLFNEPDAPADALADVPRGRMAPDQVVRLLQDVAAACDVVGLAVAEYMPWEAIRTRNMLRKLPLLAG